MFWKLLNAPWPEKGEFPKVVLDQASERIHHYWIVWAWPFLLGVVILAIEATVEKFQYPHAYLWPVILMSISYFLGFFRRLNMIWLIVMVLAFVLQGMLFKNLGAVTALSLILPYTFAGMLLPGRKRVFIQAWCVIAFWFSLLYDVFPASFQLDPKPYVTSSYDILMATLTFQCLRFLNRLAVELNTSYVAQEVTQQVTERSQQFLARVSHELRTPLNSVLGFAKLLKRGTLTEPQTTFVTQIVQEGEQLNQLVSDLLDSAHLSSGKLTLNVETLDINKICQSIANEAQGMLKPDVALKVSLNSDLPQVHGDNLRIHQIVRNLVGNAAKYTAHGTITVKTDMVQVESKPVVLIAVSDTGPGIPAEEYDLVFAPFVKRDNRSAGVGLGLDIARQLARLHGGDICLESIVGHGSTFTVELPVVELSA